MQIIKTFDQIKKILNDLPISNKKIVKEAQNYQNNLLKPKKSLGILEQLAVFYCGWRNCLKPKIKFPQTIIFAGNHGVYNQSISSFPQEVTMQMVKAFKEKKAAINQLSSALNSNLEVIELKLDKPTLDFTKGPSMSKIEFLEAFNIGFNSVKSKSDTVILGEMGIGNTTVASAITSALIGGEVSSWVGRGTSQGNSIIANKVSAIKRGLKINKNRDPLEVLRCLGGREQVAIFASTIRARLLKIPVIVDGFICSASILPSFIIEKSSIEHCIFGHCSSEKGHKKLLKFFNKKALLNLKMALGEGTGATLALGILKSALDCHNKMGTFKNSEVSNSIN